MGKRGSSGAGRGDQEAVELAEWEGVDGGSNEAKRKSQNAKSDAARALEEMLDAYEGALASMRDRDGRPIQATELEKIALMNRVRKRLAVNAKMPPGYNGAMTVDETARHLGVTRGHVYDLCKVGRLNPVKVDRRLYIPPEEVRAYRHEQDVWRAAGGEWTPYGRLPRKEPTTYRPVGDGESVGGRQAGDCQLQVADGEERWVTAKEATAMLGVTRERVQALVKAGSLVARIDRTPTNQRGRMYVRLDSVLEQAAVRESREWKRGISAQDWKRDLRHPVVRTKLEAAPGDALIRAGEAAELLGVHRERISALVREGRLFGFQKKPGRNGCPLYLSARQVMRYAEDPMRLKRHAARMEGAAPPELKTGYDNTEWRDWHGMSRYEGRHDQRDRGEFVSTYQAAEMMGVTASAVKALRRRGRLTGHQCRSKSGPRKWAWWFFRRDDIDDMIADREYARRRRAYEKGRRRG